MALRAMGLKGLITAGSSYSLTDPNMGSLLARLVGNATHTGTAINDVNSMQVTAFWSCVRIVSETTGGMPLSIYEVDSTNGNLTKVDHDLGAILIDSPNANMTKVEFWEALAANLAQQGNAFAMRDTRTDGSIFQLTPMASSLVTPGIDKDTGLVVYDYNDRGKWITLPQEKVWHIKGFGMNGLVGLSPIVYGRNALGIGLTTEEFQGKFFANGASPSLVVSVPQWLNTQQRQQARENLEKMWGGMDNVHKARLLEGGMTVQPSTMQLREAQFSELRGLTLQEIARLMRVPPHMIMDLSRSTNNNIEQQSLEFVMFSMLPYTTRLESSISKWLMRPDERRKYVAKFSLDHLLKADAASRGTLLSQLVNCGVLNRNEVRATIDRNRSDAPGMDDYTAQMQYVPVGMLAQLAAKGASAMPMGGKRTDPIDAEYVMLGGKAVDVGTLRAVVDLLAQSGQTVPAVPSSH
jgi:HK97 family phage portal protein